MNEIPEKNIASRTPALTETQLKILQFLAEGKSQKQIVDLLFGNVEKRTKAHGILGKAIDKLYPRFCLEKKVGRLKLVKAAVDLKIITITDPKILEPPFAKRIATSRS